MLIKLPSTSLHLLALSHSITCITSQNPTIAPDAPSPTSSPQEFSNVTVYNDGATHTIDDGSHEEEVFVITQNTKLELIEGGAISAPVNSEWPAIRLSVGSTLNATGGIVSGATDAIQLNNGQSSAATGGYAEFYDGVQIVGGDSDTIGGDALVVNGFGTEAIIYGGAFTGGGGSTADGMSVRVLNSASVHIHGGTFSGDMLVERNGLIALHGCFSIKDGTRVIGLFADDSEFNVNINSESGGSINFVSVPEQECDTAPSVAPTAFPTLSPQPTAAQGNGDEMAAASAALVLMNLITFLLF